jgi:hypothetical protein
MTRRAGLVALFVVLAGAGVIVPHPARAAETPHARRLLLLSMPSVTYDDLELAELPNISKVLDDSAIADLSVRGARRQPGIGDGYVTIGAGARAVARSGEGQCLAPTEPFEGGLAGDAMERRAGASVGALSGAAVVCLAQPAIIDKNDKLLFDAKAGILGDTLAAHGFDRAVIANGDRAKPIGVTGFRRAAGLALADHDGVVPGGDVTQDLLEPDPAAPFGVRAARDAFVKAFRENWHDKSVVLVEASDLLRFDAYRSFVADDAEPALKHQLLREFDGLLGRLLADVDPSRDAVMIVGPAHLGGGARLMMATLRAPGVKPGLLSSSYTRRSGLVSIVDVGPTILDVLGIERPNDMEGRPFEVSSSPSSTAHRVSHLEDVNDASRFRDRVRGRVTSFTVTSVMVVVFTALAAALFWPRLRTYAEVAAFFLLAFLPATFLARILPFHDWGVFPYWGFLLGFAIAITVAIWFTTARESLNALVASLSLVVATLVGDCLTGSHLQYNSPFGYSATVAGRFAGIGNLGYAQLSVGALVLAALVVAAEPRRGRIFALALFALAIAVDGAPFWGADVGGVLSMVPAFAVCATLLLGWKLRVRTLALYGGATVALLTIFALIDVSRPEDQRTHLGRLVDSTAGGGWDSFWTVIQRKVSENLATLSSVWAWAVPILVVAAGLLLFSIPGRVNGLLERLPTLRPAAIGLAVLAVLGYALNDSGVAVPGMMLVVLVPSLVILITRLQRRAEPPAELAT